MNRVALDRDKLFSLGNYDVREINTFLFCYQSAFNFEWNVRGGKSLLIPMKLIIVINSS